MTTSSDSTSRRGAATFVALAAVVVEWLGFHWDIGWHGDKGRDTFFSPPHLMIVAGILVGAAIAFAAVVRSGWRARPGMALVLASVGLTGLSLAVDNWFHAQFGVDVAVWSPPHLLLGLSMMLGVLGVVADYARAPNANPAVVCVIIGVFVAVATIFLAEYEFGYPHFRLLWSPLALAALFGLGMAMAAASTGLRWAGTITAISAAGARAVGLGLNAAVGRSLPAPPLGVLAGAIAFDLARRRLRTGPAIVVGWAVTFAVQVPWLRAAGKTWWVGPILVPALLLGAAVVAGGATLGRGVGALAVGVPHRRAALLPALAVVAATGVSAWGQLVQPATTLAAEYDVTGSRVRLEPRGAARDDWVSVVGPTAASGLFRPVPVHGPVFTPIAGSYLPQVQGDRLRAVTFLPELNLTWLGALTWAGGGLEGDVEGSGEFVGVWYLRGDHVYAGLLERGTAGRVELAKQLLRPEEPPPPWAAPVGTGTAMALAAGGLAVAGRILRRQIAR